MQRQCIDRKYTTAGKPSVYFLPNQVLYPVAFWGKQRSIIGIHTALFHANFSASNSFLVSIWLLPKILNEVHCVCCAKWWNSSLCFPKITKQLVCVPTLLYLWIHRNAWRWGQLSCLFADQSHFLGDKALLNAFYFTSRKTAFWDMLNDLGCY
jgi:hypothetical protein